MKLDRTKPFGVVFGAADGVAYEQDGLTFDIHDRLIGEPPAKASKAPKAPKPAPVEASAVDAQLDAQMEG